MQKKNIEVVNLNAALNELAEHKNPIGIYLAKLIKTLKPIVDAYQEKRSDILEKYLKKDINGQWMGVEREVPVVEGNTVVLKKQRMTYSDKMGLNDIECEERTSFNNAIKELDKTLVDIPELSKLQGDKKVFDSKKEKEISLKDWFDTQVEPKFTFHFLDFELFEKFE